MDSVSSSPNVFKMWTRPVFYDPSQMASSAEASWTLAVGSGISRFQHGLFSWHDFMYWIYMYVSAVVNNPPA